ncbi:zinc metalloprotease [Chryseobacterium daecheongense]|uniref:Pregnancy-associated plasma protein-A n=1 Tax=Chryseobacterium daecheongense TaxID=192389 RepID=A0A3N0VS28_9FLAO|nr:zinc metalloprotease [Chryseobacterium daecheongense]ROH95575.1 zinc metalloprotease [Chryseobacterium daecheongense]TDX92048.1 pregnancy-associated plasma protein-A [Chryseobacterium daecheongense]
MKKLLFGALIALVVSCNNENETNSPQNSNAEQSGMVASKGAFCGSDIVRQKLLSEDPAAMQRMLQLENKTADFIEQKKLGRVLADGSVEIPVIFNVLYTNSTNNVSDTRINSQIDVLNKAFASTHADVSSIPAEFQPVNAGDTKIKFRLVQINRKSTTKSNWAPDDKMKKSTTGGVNATDPTKYLNIWVVDYMPYQTGYVLGYATFPESAGLWNDGVVMMDEYVGAGGPVSTHNKGRVTVHEVGHYLNLRHIWGDANCGNDLVDDTPQQITNHRGVPSYPRYETCGGVSRSVMFMNYMDYSDETTLFMFTKKQNDRMQATVSASGPRAGLRIL